MGPIYQKNTGLVSHPSKSKLPQRRQVQIETDKVNTIKKFIKANLIIMAKSA